MGSSAARAATRTAPAVAPPPPVRVPRLPRSTTRRRPPPARRFGYAAYRLVVSSDGRLHVFGPSGRDAVLSDFAEECRTTCDDVAVALRNIRSVLKVLEVALRKIPRARELLVRDVRSAREVYRHFVLGMEWKLQWGRRPNDGFFIITGDDARSYENAITVLALSRLFQFLTLRDEFPDLDPMRMDPARSRLLPGVTRVATKEDGKVTVDTDLMYRTPQAGRIAPRTGNPFFMDEILKQGDAAGWPLVVRTLILAKGLTGGRDFQLRPIPVYNWLVLGKGEFIHAPGKYSKGKLVQRLRVNERLLEALRQLMDQTYPHLGGYEGLVAMARHPVERLKLRTLWIFTLDRVSPVSYAYVNDCWWRPVVERMGPQLDLGDENDDPVARWPVQHWLRHEFTNAILLRIDDAGLSEKDKLVQQILLARYMGWKSAQAMLQFYGRWFFNREVDLFITALTEAANDNSLPSALMEEYDQAGVTDEEEAEARALMGGLLKAA